MITTETYSKYLGNRGGNLSEVRKSDSIMIMNATFRDSPGYKRVYILDSADGWIWTDAKYSQHSRQSIKSDDVDYYLQFRPNEHHSVGTYVFIPNDTSTEVGFYDEETNDPFNDKNFQDIFDNGKLWMIVDRNNSNQFVRYMVLPVNHEFKWIAYYNGTRKIMSCYGITRSANSYTSGLWLNEYNQVLDTITGFWLPDSHYIFGDKLSDYNIDDTRYVELDMRFIVGTNMIHPHVWRVTKIDELQPKGIFKIIIKRDEYNEKTDNLALGVCDYYNDSGEIMVDETINDNPSASKTSTLWWAIINNDGEIEINDTELIKYLPMNDYRYFVAEFSDNNVIPQWRIEYSDNNSNSLTITDEEKQKYCDLLKIVKHSDNSISIKTSKSKALLGKLFNLTVQDANGEYKSTITDMEVRSA